MTTLFNIHGRMRAVQGKCAFEGEKSKAPVYPAGVSLFWSSASSNFYNSKLTQALNTQYNIQVIRVAMTAWSGWSDGYTTNPSKYMVHAETMIKSAIEAQIYVIVDWHCEGDNSSYVQQAKDFFGKIAQKYGATNSNIIYEIWNEPTQQKWDDKIRPYCIEVIKEIRKFDPSNLILCGTETWSQRVQDAAKNPIQDNNVGYVLHFYSNLHGPWLYNGKQSLNIPIFVSEWGTPGNHQNTTGFVQWLETNKIPHCSWAWNNKNEALSYLQPQCQNFTGPYKPSDLTDTGKILTKIIQEWKGNTLGSVQEQSSQSSQKSNDKIVIDINKIRSNSNTGFRKNTDSIFFSDTKSWVTYAVELPHSGSYKIRCFVKNTQASLAKIRFDYDSGKNTLVVFDVEPSCDKELISNIISIPIQKLNLGINCTFGKGIQINSIQIELV